MEDTENSTVIPFETTRLPDNTKPVGFELVVQDGKDGLHTTTTLDGQVVSDKTSQPKNQVVYYGTLEEDVPEAPPAPIEKTEPKPEWVNYKFPPPNTSDMSQTQWRSTNNKEILNMNPQLLKKATLEAARLLVFAIPGILITVLTSNPELGGSLGATILLVLKSVDRGIHEDKTNEVKGLLPF